MDSSTFDRIVKMLAGIAPRRKAVRGAVGMGVATVASRLSINATEATKKRRKRCRRRGQTCGGKKKCCNKSGLVRCQEFPATECNDIFGFHCCGLEGAKCDPDFGEPTGVGPDTFGNCSCCDPLWCGRQLDESFRCQTEST